MSESSPRRRRWWKLLLLFFVFSLVVLGILGWYVTTEGFQETVRRRVIASLEKATGGRVEIGQFHTIPFRLRVDVRNLTIHGREAPDQVPYLHVDRLEAEMQIISLLSADIRLHSLALEHPVFHLIVYPDGSTNQPVPKVERAAGQGPVEEFFSLSVSNIEVRGGEVQCEENRIALDFDARDVALTQKYSFLRQQYEAKLALGNVTTRFQRYPPLAWHLDASLILTRDRVDISSVTVASGKSEIHFTGGVRDFKNPQVSGTYRGNIDLAELAVFFGQRGLRQGTAAVQGKGSWKLRDFTTDGELQVKDLDWSGGPLKLKNGRVTTAFSVTPQRLRLSSIKAEMLGGEASGEVDVTNWQASLESKTAMSQRRVIGRIPPGSLQRGAVRLKLTGFPLSAATDPLSSNKFPLDRLNLGGAASGNVEVLWVGSVVDAETRVDLTIGPPSRPLPGQLDVRGQIRGLYRGSQDELQLDEFHLVTPASEISAAGDLSATTSLRLSFSSRNVAEWRPLLQAVYGAQDLPFKVRGAVNFNGNASGELSAILLNGNLEVYDFETTLPAGTRRPAQTIHWDALTATVQFSGSSLAARNGSLIHGMTLTRFDASTALSGGAAGDDSPFTLRLDVRKADVAEVAQLAGLRYPLSGTANLTVYASGTRAHPHGEGRLEVRDARAYSTPIPFLRGDLRLSDGEFQLNNIESSVYDTPVTGSVAVNIESEAFRVNLAGRGLDLARFPKVHNDRITVDGHADFAVQASGTADRFSLDGRVHVADLVVDKEREGDFDLEARTEGRQVVIQGQSKFEKAELKVQGAIGLDGDSPADLNVSFRQLDMDSLIRVYLGDKVTSHALLEGKVNLRGPLRSPREWKVQADLDSVDAELEHVRVHNAEPVRFEVVDRTLRIERFHLEGSGTDFTAHGTVSLEQPRNLDLRLDGTVNMTLLQTLNPDFSARGMLGLNLNASGPLAQPVLQGKLAVKDAFLSQNEFPSGLSELNGTLVFDQNRIQIESLNGKTGGGTVELTGSGTYLNRVLNLDFAFNAHDVRLRYPPGVSSTVDANLRLTGTSNSALLSGDALVTKLSVTPGFDFASYLEKSKLSVAAIQSNSPESRVKLDVRVSTTPELQMQTALAKLSGTADLRVRGSAARPVITGRANVTEGGEIAFNGTKYRVERLDVTFSNPAKTTPEIDLRASTRVRDYDITINIVGDVSKPNGLKATWRSEPPLPEADVIALLALGRTQEESAALQSTSGSAFSGAASNLLISQALNSAVSSRVQHLFGVSRIKIDPQGLASTTNVVRGPQVTIEQQVANNLTVTYSTNVSVTSQQVIQVEYNVSRNVSIVALRDQNGVVSFDVKIRRHKR